MMIVYGHRWYGRVHGHGGEHAQTQFAHIYYVPLIPMSSFWVTSGSRGFYTRMSARSVIATYLRWWGLVAAVATFAISPDLTGALIAAPLVAAVALAWSWRSIRGAHAIRQSDADRVVFGSHCPPELLTTEMRQGLRSQLDERWAKLGGGRSPEDVVSFGARSPEEGLFAYGLLRLAAVEHRDPAAAAGADKLLAGIEREHAEGSPYRGIAFAPVGADEEPREPAKPADAPTEWNDRTLCNFGACVGVIGPDGACKTCGKRPGVDVEAPRAPAAPKKWWMAPVSQGQRIALVAAVAWSVGLTWAGAGALLPAIHADSAFLASHSHTSRYVEVTCDQLELAGTFTDGTKAYACVTSNKLLPVVGAVDSTDSGTKLVGQLNEYSGDYQWPRELIANPDATAGYLRAHGRGLRILTQLAGIGGLAGALATLGVLGLVIVRRRRAKRGA